MSAKRGFSKRELRRAQRMLVCGETWAAIGRALGRRSADGIRRRLDPKYRADRNAYQASYMRERYQPVGSPEIVPQVDASIEEIAAALSAIEGKS